MKGQSHDPKPAAAWYLVPIFLGILGSLIMWLVFKDNQSPYASDMIRKGWIIGIVLTALGFVLNFLFFYLFSSTA